MKWNKKFVYPKSIRSTENGIRRYLIGEKKLPSVTSILDATKSEEDKAALANWRERTGLKESEAIVKAASSRGSKMHAYLESFILGRENLSFFDDNEQYKIMAKQELARHDGVQAIGIMTPSGDHYKIAKEFIKSNVHII